MDEFVAQAPIWLRYLRENPWVAVAALGGAVALYWLAQRRSRVEREAEKRLAELRNGKAGHYDRLRPPS